MLTLISYHKTNHLEVQGNTYWKME